MKHYTLLTCLLALTLLGCATTGPGGKTSLIIIPSSQEVAIGAGMAQELAQTETTLADSTWQRYLDEVGQKLVVGCDRKDIQYHFTVIHDDQVNAFAAPGGYIYFYTGLLRLMDNEAELAAVLAHEISHVVARHGVKRIQLLLGAGLAYELVMGDKESKALETAVGIGLTLLSADYSRDNEREADDYGMTYMIRAGYNPEGMTSMFSKLATMSDRSSDVFENLFASHPDTQERIADAEARLSAMRPIPANLTLGEQRYSQMKARLPKAN